MARYQIRVKERLPLERSDWFEGLTVTRETNGDTTLTGDLPDQTALYSLLMRARDLALTLIAVTLLEPES
jgi:hypothetical protein